MDPGQLPLDQLDGSRAYYVTRREIPIDQSAPGAGNSRPIRDRRDVSSHVASGVEGPESRLRVTRSLRTVSDHHH